jgi:hypothetical protein
MKKQFYIYVHCRPSGEPFYIGKGCSNRAYRFESSYTTYYKRIVRKHGKENLIVYVRNCKNEAQAHQHEVWLIAYGRAQGWRLCNITDGGDGVSGWKPSIKTRATWRKQRKGNAHARGIKWSAASRINGAIAQKTRFLNPAARLQTSVACMGRPAHNKGVPCSEEQIIRIKETMKRKYIEDEEFKASQLARLELARLSNIGRKWVTDGKHNKLIKGCVPSGWVFGRVM